MSVPVNLAVEDELSEVVLLRILAEMKKFSVGTVHRRGGYGYLKRTIHGWNTAAKGIPFVVLTDLTGHECPLALIQDWLQVPRQPNLIFRVAVREVESWLLADRANLSRFLNVPERLIPMACDTLADPKGTLVSVADRSRSKVLRERIVAK